MVAKIVGFVTYAIGASIREEPVAAIALSEANGRTSIRDAGSTT
jgi:hypothetical protein